MSKCDTCQERCPQAELAHQAALGRMYATNEFIALLKKNEKQPMTNADRIRAMTDEELAYWALHKAPEIGREYNESYLGLIKWLQQPAKGE